MANYNAHTRTNYFSVTNESKFRTTIDSCVSDNKEIQIWEKNEKFAFGCHGQICGFPNESDDEDDLAGFHRALQEVLSDDDAILITETGIYGNLLYQTAFCTIITKNAIRFFDLRNTEIELAREMLNNFNYITQTDY
jgi:hypothetical protein